MHHKLLLFNIYKTCSALDVMKPKNNRRAFVVRFLS